MSRNRIDINEHDFGCSYSGALVLEKIYLFKSNDDVEANISQIMSHTGLADNFTVKAADVDNACALIKGNKRYILYNQLFIQNVASETKSKFGALSILAHEICNATNY